MINIVIFRWNVFWGQFLLNHLRLMSFRHENYIDVFLESELTLALQIATIAPIGMHMMVEAARILPAQCAPGG